MYAVASSTRKPVAARYRVAPVINLFERGARCGRKLLVIFYCVYSLRTYPFPSAKFFDPRRHKISPCTAIHTSPGGFLPGALREILLPRSAFVFWSRFIPGCIRFPPIHLPTQISLFLRKMPVPALFFAFVWALPFFYPTPMWFLRRTH